MRLGTGRPFTGKEGKEGKGGNEGKEGKDAANLSPRARMATHVPSFSPPTGSPTPPASAPEQASAPLHPSGIKPESAASTTVVPASAVYCAASCGDVCSAGPDGNCSECGEAVV